MKKMNRLLITGAAGNIGTECRKRLKNLANTLRLSDKADLGPAGENEEVIDCDLSEKESVANLVKDCEGVLHLGGKSVEGTWDVIRDSNIEGVFNLYEAVRKNDRPRVIFASSNHAIGYYKQDELLDAKVVTRPDSLYGVSKVFGEAMASLYYEKFGIETACIRLGSCYPEPKNHRMLSTWMSFEDFTSLVERIFTVPRLGCPIIYGVSNNDSKWWDNREVDYLGWHPKDNAEKFRSKLDAEFSTPALNDYESVYQGGNFVKDGIHEE